MRERPHLIPAILASALLIVAIAPCPTFYYTVLRWIVSVVAIYISSIGAAGFTEGEKTRVQKFTLILFPFIAILFNPLAPFHLAKVAWIPIDLVCSVLFLCIAYALKRPLVDGYTLGSKLGYFFMIAAYTFVGLGIVGIILEAISSTTPEGIVNASWFIGIIIFVIVLVAIVTIIQYKREKAAWKKRSSKLK